MGSLQDKRYLKTFYQFVLNSVHIVLRSICTAIQINGNPSRVLNCSGCYMSVFPRTLRTSLNSPYTPYTPYTPNTPNNSNELNTSNLSGFPLRLKKLILTAYAMRGEVEKSNQSNRSNCSGSYKSRTLGIFGMDRMGRNAQGVE